MISTPRRNLPLEWLKLLASILVIFLHVEFPGKAGDAIECIARFAVPLFFAVSGYYSYLSDRRSIAKRIRRIFRLLVIASVLYMLPDLFRVITTGNSVIGYLMYCLTPRSLTTAAFLNESPFMYHLWYLYAVLEVYIVFYFYTLIAGKENETNYAPLYYIGTILLLLRAQALLFGMLEGKRVNHDLYRNALFFGMPMFAMGLFLRQYQELIVSRLSLNWKKAAGLILLGVLFSELQYFTVGESELPAGMLIAVPALFLAVQSREVRKEPSAVSCTLAAIAGSASQTVYIIHLLVPQILESCARSGSSLCRSIVNSDSVLPAAVALISLVTALAWAGVKLAVRKRLPSRKAKQAGAPGKG